VGRQQGGAPANGRRARGPVLPVRRATGESGAPEVPAHWPIPTFHPTDPGTEPPPAPLAGSRSGAPAGTSPPPGPAAPPSDGTPRPTTGARTMPIDRLAPPPTVGRADPAPAPLSDEDWRARLGLDEDDLAGADWATVDAPRAPSREAEPAGDDDWRARLGIDREDVFDRAAPGPGDVVPPIVAYRPPPLHDRRSSAAEPPPPLPPVAADRRNAVALSLAGLFDGGADHDSGAVPAAEAPVRRVPPSAYTFDTEPEEVVAPPRHGRPAIVSPGGLIAILALIGAVYIVASFALHSSPTKTPGPAPVTPAVSTQR